MGSHADVQYRRYNGIIVCVCVCVWVFGVCGTVVIAFSC
uniref:Uncharacterized protein n=1 Tax=Anguilla anguilla TaxID=7936 RepID=A0A0E9SPD7_ANGAN